MLKFFYSDETASVSNPHFSTPLYSSNNLLASAVVNTTGQLSPNERNQPIPQVGYYNREGFINRVTRNYLLLKLSVTHRDSTIDSATIFLLGVDLDTSQASCYSFNCFLTPNH